MSQGAPWDAGHLRLDPASSFLCAWCLAAWLSEKFSYPTHLAFGRMRVVGRIATYRIYRVRVHATNACIRAALALMHSG